MTDPTPVMRSVAHVAGVAQEAFGRLDPGAAARALGRLRVILAEHNGDRGVRFGSRAWIITARR